MKWPNALFILLILALCSTISPAQTPVAAKLEAYFQSAAQNDQFNGTVLIARGDSILYQKAFGWKNFAAGKKNGPHTRYQLGSLTKPFTSELILLLQQQQKLSIKDKLTKYFPGYPGGDQITLQNLLDQTSGIPTYNVEESDTIAWTPVKEETMLALFRDKPLEFKPGSQYRYSNANYYLLGLIIAKVTGKSYYQAADEMLLAPLGLRHSGFDFIHLRDTDKAVGYAVLNKSEQRPAHLTDSTVSAGAGAMYSTADDLFKWARSVAKNQVLSPALWREAHQPVKSNYGYGWISGRLNGESYYGHGGGIMGFTSFLAYFPKRDITIIMLTNVFNEGDPATLPAQDVSAILFDKPYELVRPSAQLSSQQLANYAGSYFLVSEPKRVMVIELQGKQLIARIPGAAPLELQFQTETKFLFKNVANTSGVFEAGSNGGTRISVDQNGGHYQWQKKP